MSSISFSGRMMSQLSSYRNEGSLGRRLVAQIGYGLITLVGLVEALVATTFALFAIIGTLLSGCEDRAYRTAQRMAKWKMSADLSFNWALGACLLNPFVSQIITAEREVEVVFRNFTSCDC